MSNNLRNNWFLIFALFLLLFPLNALDKLLILRHITWYNININDVPDIFCYIYIYIYIYIHFLNIYLIICTRWIVYMFYFISVLYIISFLWNFTKIGKALPKNIIEKPKGNSSVSNFFFVQSNMYKSFSWLYSLNIQTLHNFVIQRFAYPTIINDETNWWLRRENWTRQFALFVQLLLVWTKQWENSFTICFKDTKVSLKQRFKSIENKFIITQILPIFCLVYNEF